MQSFRMWSKSVRGTKIARCKAALKKNLFILNPVFQAAMLQLNKLCADISREQLFAVESGHAYQLSSFVDAQQELQESGQETLSAFADAALECIMNACQASLAELEASLAEVRNLW
jgi:cell division septum initiation protein DivIVA